MAERKKMKGRLYPHISLEDMLAMDPIEIEDGCSFLPFTDIVEREDSFLIEMELPGVLKNEIDIEIVESAVIVKGVKQRVNVCQKGTIKYHCMGRAYGRFKRRFDIPKPFNSREVKAKLDNGLLVIILPKIIDKRKKSIKIPVE